MRNAERRVQNEGQKFASKFLLNYLFIITKNFAIAKFNLHSSFRTPHSEF